MVGKLLDFTGLFQGLIYRLGEKDGYKEGIGRLGKAQNRKG